MSRYQIKFTLKSYVFLGIIRKYRQFIKLIILTVVVCVRDLYLTQDNFTLTKIIFFC